MKKFKFGLFAMVLLLFTANMAFGDTFFRATGAYIPEQDFEINPGGGAPDITIESDNSFGAFGEVGFYSPGGLLSFGVEGGFENLSSFAPIAGVERVEAQVYSLLGKMCANVKNKTKFEPFACGGAGMYFIDPSLTIAGGPAVGFDAVSASGYSVGAGVRYRATKAFSLIAGYRYNATFRDPVIALGIGPGVELNLDRNVIYAGVEF